MGDPDKDGAELHRLDVEAALPIIEAAGFDVASSDLLRNPDDSRTAMVFNPVIGGDPPGCLCVPGMRARPSLLMGDPP